MSIKTLYLDDLSGCSNLVTELGNYIFNEGNTDTGETIMNNLFEKHTVVNPYVLVQISEGTFNPAEVLKAAEKIVISTTLKANMYNQSKSAIELKMSRGTFRRLLREHFGDKYFRNSTVSVK